MKSIAAQLEGLFRQALVEMLGDEGRSIDPLIRTATDEKFGDYQSNLAMSLGKRLGQKPREIAGQLADRLNSLAAGLCEPFEVAGPGFINIRLTSAWLARTLDAVPDAGPDDRLGIEPAAEPQCVVVDYSSPNIAKQMHVGHLRSTIIGDSIARVLEFVGHEVVRQNHLGDWGTQIGIILVAFDQLRSEGRTIGEQIESYPIVQSNRLLVDLPAVEVRYKELNARMQSDVDLQAQVRAKLQRLQRSDPLSPEWHDWQDLRNHSIFMLNELYTRLGVDLAEVPQESDDTSRSISPNPSQNRKVQPKYCGESWYRHDLLSVVKDLRALPSSSRIEVRENQGALCVFLKNENGTPAFKGPEGDPLPLIVQKSDGTYLYATTDLAAIRYRIDTLGATRIIYVVGAPQTLHFQMLFATVRALGWTKLENKGAEARLEHVAFGSILGEDRRMLRTRSGETIKLKDLLDEAVKRAEALIRATEADPDKRRGFTEDQIHAVAEAVGIGAVKYADLSQNRQSDYVFSWDKMLAMDGNTAPYLMYAYARIRSIHRKGQADGAAGAAGPIALDRPQERSLGKRILQFAEVLESASQGLRMNLLTDYLYDLAVAFMRFYETCPVLSADTAEQRASRLRLCNLTARTLNLGLSLLGIQTVERM